MTPVAKARLFLIVVLVVIAIGILQGLPDVLEALYTLATYR